MLIGLKNKKRFLIIAFVEILFIIAISLYWNRIQTVQYISPINDTNVIEIEKGSVFTQDIKINYYIDNLSIYVANGGGDRALTNSGMIECSLRQGDIVRECSLNVREIGDWVYVDLPIDLSAFQDGDALLEISGIDTELGSSIFLIYQPQEAYGLSEATLNGHPLGGALCVQYETGNPTVCLSTAAVLFLLCIAFFIFLLALTARNKRSIVIVAFVVLGLLWIYWGIEISHSALLYQFEIFIRGLAVTIALLIVGVIFLAHQSNERLAFCITLGFGLLYCLVLTPFSPPDELAHYHNAYHVSNYLLLQLDAPDMGEARYLDTAGFTDHSNTSEGYIQVLENLTLNEEFESEVTVPISANLDYFIEYLPQAIGIAVGRILNLNFVGVFYLGRLCNLIFYSACVYLAVRTAKRFQPILAMVALLPMTLHQAASYSYDGFINGVTFVLIACLINGIYGSGAISKTEYIRILLLGALLAPAKIVYTVILLLALAIPRERFVSRRQQVTKVFLLFGAAGVMLLLFGIPLFTRAMAGSMEEVLNWEGQYNYSLQFIVENPMRTVHIFVNSLIEKGIWYYETCIGQSLSGLSLVVPTYFVIAFTALLLLAVPENVDNPIRMGRCQRFLLIMICISGVLLIMLSMFLRWTSNTRAVIEGVQGRYFLPFLPLGLMALSNRTIVRTRDYLKWQYGIAAVLQSWIIIYILQYTI